MMFGGDIRLETARLLNQAGVITDEEFQAVQGEVTQQQIFEQEGWRRQRAEATERWRALPWWKRFVRGPYGW